MEKVLATGPVPVTNLRAAMILGSGSASFEMLRYLVERLPVMTPPRWVNTPCQPMAIADVLNYLVGCLEYAKHLWWLRGLLDCLAGGVGRRRGRRHPKDLWVGDGVDFWRVLEVKENQKLVLLAEMKVPGEATLTFEITPFADGTIQLRLLSRFLPRGIAGILYCYSLYPFHEIIFFGMAKAMARSTGKEIHGTPERFTPRIAGSCALP